MSPDWMMGASMLGSTVVVEGVVTLDLTMSVVDTLPLNWPAVQSEVYGLFSLMENGRRRTQVKESLTIDPVTA